LRLGQQQKNRNLPEKNKQKTNKEKREKKLS
jgi:hypothetical protein